MVQYKERLNLFFSINMYICICEISHGDEISMHSEEKLGIIFYFLLSWILFIKKYKIFSYIINLVNSNEKSIKQR